MLAINEQTIALHFPKFLIKTTEQKSCWTTCIYPIKIDGKYI